MGRLAWIVFVLVQLFGELGPWAGLHLKSAIGPALWFAGIVVMMPGRLLALWLEQIFWGVRLTPIQTTVVFAVVEVAANLLFWLLCARCWRFLRYRRTVLQVLFGLALCVGIGAVLIYSSLPIFWEHEDLQPHVYSITWRSGVMLVVLLAVTQGISFLAFRRVRWGRAR